MCKPVHTIGRTALKGTDGRPTGWQFMRHSSRIDECHHFLFRVGAQRARHFAAILCSRNAPAAHDGGLLSVSFRQARSTCPWLSIPSAESACFGWFIVAADEASATKRFFAVCESRLAKERCEDHSLTVFLPCFLHILHRTVVPLLKSGNLLNDLFRAANVLIHYPYIAELIQSIRRTINGSMVVVHGDNFDQQRHTCIAREILRLTLLESKTLDDFNSCRQLVELHDRVIQSFSGDWTTTTLQYRCRRHGCTHDAYCRRLGVGGSTGGGSALLLFGWSYLALHCMASSARQPLSIGSFLQVQLAILHMLPGATGMLMTTIGMRFLFGGSEKQLHSSCCHQHHCVL